MKKNNVFLLVIFVILLVFGFNSKPSAVENPRVRFSINDKWKFRYFPNNKKLSKDFLAETENWESINLPHTWNADDTQDDTSTYRRGTGWYEKRISLTNELARKRIFINFEGANQKTEVFVNGKKAGIHLGGYTAFTFDITELLQLEENENLISVKVDNRFNKNIPPLSADFTFYGGIYRDVWLTAVDPVHISLDEFGSSGIYITTPDVSENSASVNIKGLVVNKSNEIKKLQVENIIFDPSGNKVSIQNSELNLKAGEQAEVIHLFENIKHPQLWSPDNPILYSVKTYITDFKKIVDVVESSFGFRFFNLDANDGFFLNGKPFKLIGTNRHQDYFELGNALPNNLHVKDLEMIKDAGFNFLRLAHYPQDPVVMETADRLGLILWVEIPIVNYISLTNDFTKNSLNMMNEMIHQNFNHPSVIFWGYMNEVFLHDSKGNRSEEMLFPNEYIKGTLKLAEQLENLTRSNGGNRITVMAIHQNPIYDETGITEIPQAVGYNLYPGWYSSSFSYLGEFLDETHKQFTTRKIIISEYGAGSDDRIHSENPKRFDFSTEYQQLYHESYIKQIFDRPFLGVTAVWAQNDFGSDRRIDSKPKINQKGLQYFDRREKDIYYLYKAKLSSEPVVRIASHDWVVRSFNSTGNNSNVIKIYSNLDEVKIFINNKFIEIVKIAESNIGKIDLKLPSGAINIRAAGVFENQIISDSVKLNILSSCENLEEYFKKENYLAVNVGSSFQYIDSSNKLWVNSQKYEAGNWGYSGGSPVQLNSSEGILNTEDDPLFQSAFRGIDSFQFDVPSGLYEVELFFAELEFDEINKRVQDISVNGNTVSNGLDIVAESGKMSTYKKILKVKTENEGIKINFKSKKGDTILNAVCINKISIKE